MCSIETHFLSYKPNNHLTIDGNDHALKFTDKGIALWGHALVLKDVNASMAGIGSTPVYRRVELDVCVRKQGCLAHAR